MTASANDTASRLLSLDTRDRATLPWVRERSRAWQTPMRRRRKYAAPRGTSFGSEETAVLQALFSIEKAAGTLLEL